MADYDISAAFQEIEDYLLSSMIRNMSHHKGAELKDGMEYSQWQAEQLKGLQIYRQNNQKRFGSKFSTLNYKIEETIKAAYTKGGLDQETAILKAIKKGFVPPSKKLSKTAQSSAEFFKVNEKKLNTLINATISDMKKAEHAVLRMANDQYRKAIFNAQVAYNTGTVTMPQAIDMATKDYLAKGINCIEYANGARVAIDAYARMALKTANTRAYLQGESAKRDEWGINTVIVNRRGVACPKCLQWVCKVYYDDVYGNVPVTDNKYPKLSTAIAGGLYHPNCKDSHTTYFEGISSHPKPLTKQEEAEAARVYNLEQQQRYNERNIRKYKRLQAGSIDPDNQQMYGQKVKQWQQKNINLISQNPELKRNYGNESTRGIVTSSNLAPKPLIIGESHGIIEVKKEAALDLMKLKKSGMAEHDFEEYVQIINNHENSSITQLYSKYADKISGVEITSSIGAAYSPSSNSLTFNFDKSIKYPEINKYDTLAHEYGHFFDAEVEFKGIHFKEIEAVRNATGLDRSFKNVASSSDEFLEAIRKDKAHIESIFTTDMKADLIAHNESSGVQDAIDGLFPKSRIRWGHGERYYNRKYADIEFMDKIAGTSRKKALQQVYKDFGFDASSQAKVKVICRQYEAASEAWGNIMSAEVCGGKTLEYVKDYLPNSYQAMLKIIKGVK